MPISFVVAKPLVSVITMLEFDTIIHILTDSKSLSNSTKDLYYM